MAHMPNSVAFNSELVDALCREIPAQRLDGLHQTPLMYSTTAPRAVHVRSRSEESGDYDSDLEAQFDKVAFRVAPHSPRLVSRQVVQTVRAEQRVEDCFLQNQARGNGFRPKLRRRRKPQESAWKPESVYKTYVDLKPTFFDRTNYQDVVPYASCFGKINMRIPKAWSRGPNRPKRRRRHAPLTNLMLLAYSYKHVLPPEPSFAAFDNPFSPPAPNTMLHHSAHTPDLGIRGFPNTHDTMNYTVNVPTAETAQDQQVMDQRAWDDLFSDDSFVNRNISS